MGKTTSKLSYFVINLSQRVIKLLCMTVFTIHIPNLDNNVLRIMHHCSTTCFMLIAKFGKSKTSYLFRKCFFESVSICNKTNHLFFCLCK